MDKFSIGDFAILSIDWSAKKAEDIFSYHYFEKDFPQKEKLSGYAIQIVGAIISLCDSRGSAQPMPAIANFLLEKGIKCPSSESSMRRSINTVKHNSPNYWAKVIESNNSGFFSKNCSKIEDINDLTALVPENLNTKNEKQLFLCIKNPSKIIKPSEIESWIISQDKNLINREFIRFLNLLKKEYSMNPNAESIEKWVNTYVLMEHGIAQVMNSLDNCSIYLTGVAEAKIRLAIIYIHSGDKKYIKLARELLDAAINIYLNQSIYDGNSFKRVVYSKWLIAITYKQERNFGYANELCEDLVLYINDENKLFEVPYSDSLLLPQRELMVINKEEIMSDYLLIHIDDISYNPEELFYTQRRLLELYILNNDFQKAKRILPELLTSFEKCKNHIDEIYHVGLYQNLFEYYTYAGDEAAADKYYKMALENAKKNFWKGKEKKLTDLKQLFE